MKSKRGFIVGGLAFLLLTVFARQAPAVDSYFTALFNWGGYNTNRGNSVAVAPNGNIYIAGVRVSTDSDISIHYYDSSLSIMSQKAVDGSMHGYDAANGIVADASSNLFVTGTTSESPGGIGFWVAKYNSSLVLQSSVTYSNLGTGFSVTLDGSGNVYTFGAEPHLWIAKFNSSLVLQSSSTLSSLVGNRSDGGGIAFDGSGNLYAIGTVYGSSRDIWVGKFDTSLNLITSTNIVGDNSGGNSGYGIAFANNAVYVTGQESFGPLTNRIYIAKLNTSLQIITSTDIFNGGAATDHGAAIAADSAGRIIVAGSLASDRWIAQFDQNLVMQDSATINGTANGPDAYNGLAISGTRAYAVGYSSETGNGHMIVTCRHVIDDFAPAPTGVQFTGATATSADASWSLNAPAEKPLTLLSTDSNFTTIVSSVTGSLGQQSTTYINLSPDTAYYFKVKVSTASDSVYSSVITTATLAAVPGIPSFVFSKVFMSSMTVAWSSGTIGGGFNPAYTSYEPEISAASDFSSIFSSTRTTALGATFTGLTANTSYYVRVRAVNQNNVPTSYAVLGSTKTGCFSNEDDHVVQDPSGRITLEVPPHALPDNFSIFFNTSPTTLPIISLDLPAAIAVASEKLQSLNDDSRRAPLPGCLVEIVARNPQDEVIGSTVAVPLTLSFSYSATNNAVDGSTAIVRPKSLAIYWLDEKHNLWVKLPTSEVDEANNTVSAKLPHLSVYALMGQRDTSLSDAYAFPVPFEPAKGHRTITFTNLAQAAKVRIYTVSGRLVQTLEEADGDGQLVWDAKSSDGVSLASGVYFYVIQSATDKRTGKLMVIR